MSERVDNRCAVYTRKSSEEGLEQSFNSLDAQREACEAYVKSQTHEGWRVLPTRYDDGGFSGGNMERAALVRLLADIDAGKIDTVVVYKVDRLTRSLRDFGKIVERMEAKGAAFVSVTQSFGTTSSMGRLTLNMLLSFAQFEREVTSERIRDKIAASKAKGMWMGGNLPLGYASKDRTLVINEAEAPIVRRVFEGYLQTRSVYELKTILEAEGIRSKRGAVLHHGALFHMLSNQIYLGKIVHKDLVHPGLHPAIIDQALFDAVQATLQDNRVRRRARAKGLAAPLRRLIFDEHGAPMSPSFSLGKDGKPRRYYVSTKLGEAAAPSSKDAIRRVPAPAIEEFVLGRLKQHDPSVVSVTELSTRIARVSVRANSVRIVMTFEPDQVRDRHDRKTILARVLAGDEVRFEDDGLHLTAPVRMKFRGGRTWLDLPEGVSGYQPTKIDAVLIGGLRRAHAALAEHNATPQRPPDTFQDAFGPASPYVAKLYRLAFLAPDIQHAMLAGQQPRGLTLQQLLDAEIPVAWCDQRTMLGFPSA